MDDTQLDSKIAELKRNWHALDLKTMNKREFTPDEWTALGRYCLDPNDAIALRALPIKLAEFKAAAQEVALDYARHQTGVNQDVLLEPSLPAKFKLLADQIDQDYHAIAKKLLGRDVGWQAQIDAGMWSKPLKDYVHVDTIEDNQSMILGRIGLPFEFIDGKTAEGRREELMGIPTEELRVKGLLTGADDNGVYLLATDPDKAPFTRSTLHCSMPVEKPTPSLFAILAC